MTEAESIRHLIIALNKSTAKSSAVVESQILNNVVYYMPRIIDYSSLKELVHSFFHWTPRYISIWQGYEAASMIMRWKLEISEPRISIHSFVSVWRKEIEDYSALNLYQLSTVAGLISCRQQLETLQNELFIDDSGTASDDLKDLKYQHFMPYWTQYMNLSQDNEQQIDDLCVLYSMIHSVHDRHLPNELLFQSLFNILIEYISNGNKEYKGPNAFAHQNLNLVCQTCEDSIMHIRHKRLLMIKLKRLRDTMKQLAEREVFSQTKKYSDKYYVNTLFIVVLVLSGYKKTAAAVPIMVMTLFYSSFIVQDFGQEGFVRYQDLIQSLCETTVQDFRCFDSLLKEMITNVQFNMDNKIYRSMMLFILEYMQLNFGKLKFPDAKYLTESIEPLIGPFLSSSDVNLRESAHLVWIEFYKNETNSPDIRDFKLKRIRDYLATCFDHYQASLMKEEQLLMIWKSVLPTIKYLSCYDNDLIRDLAHSTFIRIINTDNLQMKAVGVECLIEQLYNVPDRYLWDWLDTCKELSDTLPPVMKDTITTNIWEFVSHSHNELAIRWWYDRVVPTLSRM